MTSPDRPPRRSLRKRLLFSGAMLLLPAAFFAALEGALRLAGLGADPPPLFVSAPDHPEYRVQNPDVALRYFDRSDPIPYAVPTFFLAEKPDSALRLIVQGGSTAAGYPFYHELAFPARLQRRLEQTFAGRKVEVINTALTAVNSFALLDQADEVIAERPDAVLIYAGHNEYYGALGVASTRQFGRSPALTRWALRLGGLRTVQSARRLLGAGAPGRDEPGRSLMERMAGRRLVPFEETLYHRGLAQFASNLDRLLARYRDAGVPVLIATLAANERDQPPFVSLAGSIEDSLAWSRRLERARSLLAERDTTRAEEALTAAIDAAPGAAEAYFHRARLADARRQWTTALGFYLAAKDRDALRFRAPEAFNRIIRETAEHHGAVVVDVQAGLRMGTQGGILDRTVMLEHLHPTLDGYERMADVFYDALLDAGIGGAPTRRVSDEAARLLGWRSPVDSLVGMLRVAQLTSGWPFTDPPRAFDPSAQVPSGPIGALALALFREETTWADATRALSEHYVAQGDFIQGFQAARLLLRAFPFDDTAYLLAGTILVRAGRYRDALNYVAEAHRRRASLEAERLMGALLLGLGQAAQGLPYLERAHRLAPNDPRLRSSLARAYAATGRMDEARRLGLPEEAQP